MKSGRPTKYNERTVGFLLKMIETGYLDKAACAVAGISRATFYKWKTEYSEFKDALRKAEARRIDIIIRHIQDSGEKDWRASAWFLERRYPEEFGKYRREMHRPDCSKTNYRVDLPRS